MPVDKAVVYVQENGAWLLVAILNADLETWCEEAARNVVYETVKHWFPDRRREYKRRRV